VTDEAEASALRLRVLGRRLVLRAPAAWLPALTVDWARCLDHADAAPSGTLLADDPVEVALDPEVDAAAYRYAAQTHVTLAAIGAATGRLLMWHAGAVSTPDGRVCALVAPSGTGKTTAVRHLATHGYGYVTDETVGVTPAGVVRSYPKPLSVRTDAPVKGSLGPDDLGLARPPAALTLHRIVRLVRVPPEAPDVHRSRLERVGVLDAVLDLVAESSGLVALEQPLAVTARMLDRTGGLFRLRYSDFAAAAHFVDDLMARSGSTADALGADRRDAGAEWQALGVAPDSFVPAAAVDPDGPAIWRGSYLDAIGTADEVLVLVGAVPVRLSGIGATLWLALDRGRSVPELVRLLEAEHGPHPRAGALVDQALADLVGAGVLVRGRLPAS